MSENPETWDDLTKEIFAVFEQHEQEGRDGVCGASIYVKLADVYWKHFAKDEACPDCGATGSIQLVQSSTVAVLYCTTCGKGITLRKPKKEQ